MSNKNFFDKFIPHKNDSPKLKASKIITIVSAAVLLATLIILICIFSSEHRNRQLNEELAEAHTTVITSETTASETTASPEDEVTVTTAPPPLVQLDSMDQFVSDNPDTAGWIKVDGTSIDNVVVQTDNNDYYLNRNFYGQKAQPGTVFADYRCTVNDYNDNQSDNIVLYGHNQRDGTMFGTLNYYKVKPSSGSTKGFDFYIEHPTFEFSNLFEEYTYKIVAAFVIEVEPKHTRDGIIFDYHNYIKFGKKRPYSDFVDNILERTAINTGVDIQEGDKFLTLSTCSNEFEPSRFVVIGRRVRDGESADVDTSLSSINYNALEPDYSFIYNQ
ncbi:MAG: class B sortase [Oscillospiraceae bacterium]